MIKTTHVLTVMVVWKKLLQYRDLLNIWLISEIQIGPTLLLVKSSTTTSHRNSNTKIKRGVREVLFYVERIRSKNIGKEILGSVNSKCKHAVKLDYTGYTGLKAREMDD